MDSLIAEHTQRSAVNETDTGALAKQHFLDEYGQWQSNRLLQFNESVLGNNLREQMAQMSTYMIQVEVLQATIARTVEQNQYHHHFCFRHCSITMVFTLIFIWHGNFSII